MPSKRLVVLDEQDYKDLISQSKKPCEETSAESKSEVVEPEDLKESKEKEEDSPPKETTPEPEKETSPEPPTESPPAPTTPEPVEKDSSPLDPFLEKVPKVAHPEALELLARLSKIPAFDHEAGEIILGGKPVKNYSLKRFLATTCTKSANDNIPVPLRLFLRKNNIRKFRNKKIRLPPLATWENLHD